jgi:hypothetical protein
MTDVGAGARWRSSSSGSSCSGPNGSPGSSPTGSHRPGTAAQRTTITGELKDELAQSVHVEEVRRLDPRRTVDDESRPADTAARPSSG